MPIGFRKGHSAGLWPAERPEAPFPPEEGGLQVGLCKKPLRLVPPVPNGSRKGRPAQPRALSKEEHCAQGTFCTTPPFTRMRIASASFETASFPVGSSIFKEG